MKRFISFALVLGVLAILAGCQTGPGELAYTSVEQKDSAPAEPVPGPLPSGTNRAVPQETTTASPLLANPPTPQLKASDPLVASVPAAPPQTVASLLQRLKELDREQKEVKALLQKKLEEQKADLARQQQELATLGVANGPTAGAKAADQPDSIDRKLDKLLQRFEQMEKRLHTLETMDRGLPPVIPATGSTPAAPPPQLK